MGSIDIKHCKSSKLVLLLQNWCACSRPWRFHLSFRLVSSLSTKCLLDFDGDCLDSIDELGGTCCLNTIEPSCPWLFQSFVVGACGSWSLNSFLWHFIMWVPVIFTGRVVGVFVVAVFTSFWHSIQAQIPDMCRNCVGPPWDTPRWGGKQDVLTENCCDKIQK